MKDLELKALNEFLTVFGAARVEPGTERKDTPGNLMKLNLKLNEEEIAETAEAVENADLIELADGCADSIYTNAHAVVQLGRTPNAGRAAAAKVLLERAQTFIKMALQHDANLLSDEDIDRGLSMAEIVIRGVAATYDLPLDELFTEVHSSNMSKQFQEGEPIRRNEDGKVIKPPTYKPADIAGVLERGAKDRAELS